MLWYLERVERTRCCISDDPPPGTGFHEVLPPEPSRDFRASRPRRPGLPPSVESGAADGRSIPYPGRGAALWPSPGRRIDLGGRAGWAATSVGRCHPEIRRGGRGILCGQVTVKD